MGGIMIHGNSGAAVPQYRGVSRAERQAGAAQGQGVSREATTVSETLERLMSKVSQAENQVRQSRRTLQAGESVLDEVQDSLGRMADLARTAAKEGNLDRGALQQELEQLRESIGRMLGSASAGGAKLFLDGEIQDGADALLYAVLTGDPAGKAEAAQPLPDWLVRGLAQDAPSRAQLLAALGLDETASTSQILEAIANSSLEDNSAAGYLAALYLGAVISGGAPSGDIDPTQALDGLRQLLEQTARGVPLDQAVKALTGGIFTSFDDFQTQFTAGTAPGLERFLAGLLLSEAAAPSVPSEAPLLALLAGMEGENSDLLMSLLSALQSTQSAAPPPASPEAETALPAGAGPAAEATPAPAPVQVLQLGPVQAVGQDLSQVSFDASTQTLTVGGAADLVIQGAGAEVRTVVLTGSGAVTLQDVSASTVTVLSGSARIFSAGETVLGEVRLQEGASLSLDGSGRLSLGALRGNHTNTIYVTGGAVSLGRDRDGRPAVLSVPVFLDGPASLAVHAAQVRSPDGEALKPFDVIWKTLLPDWSRLNAMELDGRHAKMSLLNGDPARLWLTKGDPTHGYSIHTLILRGRDKSGRPRTRYAYLHWNQRDESFQELSMYPNPFSVTGGEQGRDWIYEEESQTLRVLSSQVTAISGGRGTDGNQMSFQGRIALEDRIGILALSLNGVSCQSASGPAFSLGRGNDVTLLLPYGRNNFFHGGAGGAGISLGEGTSLCVDCAEPSSGRGEAIGTLTASAGEGGAGIGRDGGGCQDQDSHILIRGGVITAAGAGGGAGIGAGRSAAIGPIIISGGTLTCTGGEGGGAGIGGALGASVGDISIQGGVVTAEAVSHAAAIGAGAQGSCGDILITEEAQIRRALGGDPGADIGASLSGSCGRILIASGASLGGAQVRTQAGIPLRTGEGTVTLPQFPLSPRTLRLEQLRVSTREQAKSAEKTIDLDRRWISQIQSAYSALYRQLEQGFSGLFSAHPYPGPAGEPVRDSASAGTLLDDMRRTLLGHPSQAADTHSRRTAGGVQRLFQ